MYGLSDHLVQALYHPETPQRPMTEAERIPTAVGIAFVCVTRTVLEKGLSSYRFFTGIIGHDHRGVLGASVERPCPSAAYQRDAQPIGGTVAGSRTASAPGRSSSRALGSRRAKRLAAAS